MGYTSAQIKARYPESYAFTLQFEGGYVDHPEDPGGCTNKGITIGTLRAWRNDPNVTCADVRMLTDEEAAEIYAENYWKPVWGDDLPVGLNTQVWDWGVNSGPHRSIMALQQLVGSADDGVMGPKTLEAAKTHVASAGIDATIEAYGAKRQAFYESLSTWPTFGKGWTDRNDACMALGKDLAGMEPQSPDVSAMQERVAALEAKVDLLERWASSFKLE